MKPALIARHHLLILLLLVASSALSQNDPQHAFARAALQQDIRRAQVDIQNAQMELIELESRAQRIRNQIEAVSFMPPDMVSSQLQAFVSAKVGELKRWEVHAATAKARMIASEATLANYRRQMGSSPAASNFDWQQKIAAQNLRLMRSPITPPPRRIPPRISNIPVGDHLPDKDELQLCEELERKVERADYDIAEINLLTAQGLPGSEKLDSEKVLKSLDLWAAWVKRETERSMHRFKENPKDFHDSEEYFRILMMVTVLQQDFKVKYHKNPKMRAGIEHDRPGDLSFYGNSQDIFIHGSASYTYDHQGTCASLPVLYVAVGRRLGYPLKLATCKKHMFARWEDKHQKFNIEATSRGLNCYPDQEYREWPVPITDEEMATGMYLKSLTPKQELAVFLGLRALNHKHNNQELKMETAGSYADYLFEKGGAKLEALRRIHKEYAEEFSPDGTIQGAFLYQILTSTNTWRSIEDKRGTHERYDVFAVERFDSE